LIKNFKNDGFSLVEAMVAMAIIAFVIVTILSGFTHQQMATRKLADKNTAIQLADLKIQELHKYGATQLTPGVFVDYILHKDKRYDIFTSDPDDPKQFRRTTVIEKDIGDVLGHQLVIQVMVEYGKDRDHYPFRVLLSTKKGV
jgi:type II secretory pathway pseudopilin PulG